jgi:hypothetical protein
MKTQPMCGKPHIAAPHRTSPNDTVAAIRAGFKYEKPHATRRQFEATERRKQVPPDGDQSIDLSGCRLLPSTQKAVILGSDHPSDWQLRNVLTNFSLDDKSITRGGKPRRHNNDGPAR